MKWFINLVASHPRAIIVLVMLMTLGLGSGLTRLEIHNNQESELPETDEIVMTNKRLESVFGKKGVIMIGLAHETSIYNRETLEKVRKLSEAVKSVPFVIEDEIVSLATFKNLKSREWGLERAPFLKALPSNEAELAQLRSDVAASNEVYGRLVSKDGSYTVILANVKQGYDQTAVSKAVYALVDTYRGPEKIYVAGDAIQTHEIDSGIQRDSGILLPAALLLMILCFMVCLRTMAGVALPLLVVVLSIVWTMGAMGWLGLPVTVVSSAIPALMVAVASSYGIHVMMHYDEALHIVNQRSLAVRHMLILVGPAILLTGLNSALGAITLIVFKVNSIREFGVATTIGVLAAMIISLTIIPAILTLLKEHKARPSRFFDHQLGSALGSLTRFAIRRRGWVLSLSAIALACIGYIGMSSLRVGLDYAQYFAPDHRLRVAFEQFNDKLGGARYMDVMVEVSGENSMERPDVLKKIYEFQRFAEAQEGVGYTSSFADIVARINSALHEDRPEALRIPDTEGEIAQYMLLYSMSGDPGDQSDLLDYAHERAKVRIMLTTSEQDDHRRLYDTFKAWAGQNLPAQMKMEFGGDVVFWLAQIHYIVKGKIENVISSVAAVFLFCALVFRSFSGGLLSIVPLSVSTLLTFSVMGIIGIRLDIGTCIITAIGVGIAVDFAILYLQRLQAELVVQTDLNEALVTTASTSGKAILFNTLANIAGFCVFTLSEFQPLQFFGWLISLMMITAAIGTLLFYPPIISFLGHRFSGAHAAVPAVELENSLKHES